MQRNTSNKLIIFITIVALIAVINHFISTANSNLNTAANDNIPEASAKDLNATIPPITQIDSVNVVKSDACPKDISKKVLIFAKPKWQQFKTDIYAQGIRYPVLQLAVYDAKPIAGTALLKRKIKTKDRTSRKNTIQKTPREFKEKLIGLMLSQGIQGVIQAVDNGDIPKEVLTQANHVIFNSAFKYSKFTQVTKILPSENEILSLVDYGLEITAKDYILATQANVPVEILNLLTSLGPAPEAENNKHAIIPLDIAAQSGNLALMKFWLSNNYSQSNKLVGKNFSDTLLLNATSTEQLDRYWNFLKNWNQFPRDPLTAKQLLSSKIFEPSIDLRQFLVKLSKQLKPKIQLNDLDKPLYQLALTQIDSINQLIVQEFPVYLSCVNIDQTTTKKLLSKDWVAEQIFAGKTVEDILKSLALESAKKVDTFRANMNRGVYQPLLMRSEYYSLLTENSIGLYGKVLLNDWDGIKAANDANQIDELFKLFLISDSSVKVPQILKDELINSITHIPDQSQKLAVRALTINQFEAMQLSSETLNRIDAMGKNIFYYATQNNNVELMKWLAQKNIKLDADPYGSDPMDAALKWNLKPQTLTTLCNLGFPIKPKHRKRLAEIRKNDPNEAEEIIANCPALGE